MSIFLKAAPLDGHKLLKLDYLTKRTGQVAMLAAASYKAQICHSLISFLRMWCHQIIFEIFEKT